MSKPVPQPLLVLYNRLQAMIMNREYKDDSYLEGQIKDQFVKTKLQLTQYLNQKDLKTFEQKQFQLQNLNNKNNIDKKLQQNKSSEKEKKIVYQLVAPTPVLQKFLQPIDYFHIYQQIYVCTKENDDDYNIQALQYALPYKLVTQVTLECFEKHKSIKYVSVHFFYQDSENNAQKNQHELLIDRLQSLGNSNAYLLSQQIKSFIDKQKKIQQIIQEKSQVEQQPSQQIQKIPSQVNQKQILQDKIGYDKYLKSFNEFLMGLIKKYEYWIVFIVEQEYAKIIQFSEQLFELLTDDKQEFIQQLFKNGMKQFVGCKNYYKFLTKIFENYSVDIQVKYGENRFLIQELDCFLIKYDGTIIPVKWIIYMSIFYSPSIKEKKLLNFFEIQETTKQNEIQQRQFSNRERFDNFATAHKDQKENFQTYLKNYDAEVKQFTKLFYSNIQELNINTN